MLEKQIQPLYVIDPNIDILTDELACLKDQIRRIDFDAWLAGKISDPNSVIVLRIDVNTISSEKLLTAIAATPGSSYFLIVQYPLFVEHKKLLDRCKDHCRIPIDITEFTYRLEKLQQFHMANIVPESQIFDQKWADFNLVGQSKEFQKVLTFTEKVSTCNAPVLIEGETGCGKEMIARAIHYLGARTGYPFIPINCGAIPDHLIENELFGHEKWAYTDAKQDYVGVIEQAHGGTLFLDEIETLSHKGQVALLRFLEDKTIKPLGSQKSKKLDVRIVVASNVALTELVKEHRFRQDLQFRLNLLHLKVPPLRIRDNDLFILSEFFMQKFRTQYQQPEKTLTPHLVEWMRTHDWPGNVRELENFIHRLFLLTENYALEQVNSVNDTFTQVNNRRNLFDRRQQFDFDLSFHEAKANMIDCFEKRYLTWLINKMGGNVTKAALHAEKERRAIGKLLKKHGIKPSIYQPH